MWTSKSLLILFLIFFVDSSLSDETLEFSCISNCDCSSYRDKMIGSSCVNYHCRCFHLKTNVTVACKRQKSIDENIVRLGDCKKNSCVVPNTHCRLGVNKCVCDENFVVSEDGKECLLQAFYGDPCKQTSQCFYELGHGAVCDSGVCVCDSIHQNVTDNNRIRCSRRLNYGDECKEHHECSTFLGKATMNCIKNECTCRDGYELFDADQNKCVKMPTSTGRLSFFSSVFFVFIGNFVSFI